MNTSRLLQVLATVGMVLGCGTGAGLAQTVPQLEQRVKADPASLQAKEALAEAYLTECELEKSLALWREILERAPDHKRARFVAQRLTAQALDLDSHLEVIAALIDKGILEGTDALLDAAARRAAGDDQKARILCLRGRWAHRSGDEARARANFETAVKLYLDAPWGARSAIALAGTAWTTPVPGEPQRLLVAVAGNDKLPAAVREEAKFRLLLVEAAGWAPQRRIAALRDLLPATTDPGVKRQILERVIGFIVQSQGRWAPEAVDAAAAILLTGPPQEQTARVLAELEQVATTGRDPATLDRLLAVLGELKLKDRSLARDAAFIRVEALVSRAVVEDDAVAMKRFLAAAAQAMDGLAVDKAIPSDGKRIWQLRGRSRLCEAQKLLALQGAADALPAIMAAKDHYLEALPTDPEGCLRRLAKIGMLLEHAREWEVAAGLCHQVADRFPYLPQGRDALMKIAQIHERLDAPMAALEVYAEYAARYPAELPYRQLEVGLRLKRLGYAGVLDFQKRTGLKPDGIVGPGTRRKLEELEAGFDVIRVRDDEGEGILRGKFVHPTIFRIARELQKAGRDYDAVQAYLLFLNLFPTKKDADDALLAVARLLRDNLLFEEALGAYAELMEYYPKGNMTSEAYIESASCLENLGRWNQAKELYEVYVKKFPKYKHVPLCKERIAVLAEVRQYQEFLAANPQSPKAPEAQYQIAAILYQKLKNCTKAAVEFAKVADAYPKHVRAADGLFSAGTAHLRTENFPAARKVLSELVRRYGDSRLADDAQYWIGHTYEYAARALGKLDERRIVLKRRSLAGRARLLADVALRRRYYPDARPGPELPEDIWTADALGVLTSGSKRDRVNAELLQAVRAYRKVVDEFKMGDMAGPALHRIGVIHTQYLKDPEKGFEAYQDLLAHYPGTKEAVDALYEVGAYYVENRKFDEAIKAYRQFIYNYSGDARVEDAMLAIARCHMEQKAWDKALDAYQSYVSKFPRGKHAGFANAQITWIRTYHY
ncbi:MAG TPA: tetratricopeptide repeat protein [Phycisphaerae bacterium]|nr:tetratricopeptide repeat protein [Phycisphaerae bacterium]